MRITLDTYGLTGLVGTVGFTIYDGDDGTTVVQARTTAGIIESPAGSGTYSVEVDDDLLAGNVVIWDDGGTPPIYASESFPADLTDYHASTEFSVSVAHLAKRAHALYDRGDLLLMRHYVEEGWRQFVHRGGHIYSYVSDLSIASGEEDAALPSDMRELQDITGVYLLDGDDETALEPLTQEEFFAARVGLDADTPTGFYFPDNLRLGVQPVPSSDVTVRIRYDGEAPAVINPLTTLPVPPLYEAALVSYAVAQVARNLGDYERAKVELARFEDGLVSWQRTTARRTRPLYNIPPYWAAPRTTNRSEEG